MTNSFFNQQENPDYEWKWWAYVVVTAFICIMLTLLAGFANMFI